LSRNWWFYSHLPRLAAQLDADIVHLAYPVPVRRGAFHCKTVVTLHDLYPYDIPENFGFPKVLFNRAVLQQCLRRADAIACVSRCTLSRLKTLNPRLAKKAAVIYNSVAPHAEQGAEIPPPVWNGHPFLLCVAQHRRNKNILLVLQVLNACCNRGRFPKGRSCSLSESRVPKHLQSRNSSPDRTCRARCSVKRDLRFRTAVVLPQLQPGPCAVHRGGFRSAGCRSAACWMPRGLLRHCRLSRTGGLHCYYVPLGPQQVEAFTNAVCVALRDPVPKPLHPPQFSTPFIAEAYLRLYRSLLPAPANSSSANDIQVPSAAERQCLL